MGEMWIVEKQRVGVGETNSSSTHALVIKKGYRTKTIEEGVENHVAIEQGKRILDYHGLWVDDKLEFHWGEEVVREPARKMFYAIMGAKLLDETGLNGYGNEKAVCSLFKEAFNLDGIRIPFTIRDDEKIEKRPGEFIDHQSHEFAEEYAKLFVNLWKEHGEDKDLKKQVIRLLSHDLVISNDNTFNPPVSKEEKKRIVFDNLHLHVGTDEEQRAVVNMTPGM